MLELEKTYLLASLPVWLASYPYKDLMDIYIPIESEHPHVRIRKNGDSMVIMKKELNNPNDLSSQEESIIHLTQAEFAALSQVPWKRIHKHRYYVPYQNHTLEVDVFQDDLVGLILMDVEFHDVSTKENFIIPDFCLCEVTQDSWFAWGILCGKTYDDIADKLTSLGYTKLFVS